MKQRYVIRRTDTGQYYKRTKSAYLKSWKPDDPRRSNWTPCLDDATLYDLAGIRSIAGHYRNSLNQEDKGVSFEVFEVRMELGVRTGL